MRKDVETNQRDNKQVKLKEGRQAKYKKNRGTEKEIIRGTKTRSSTIKDGKSRNKRNNKNN